MANPWFETVAVAQERAKQRLPRSVYSALIAGSEAGVTINDNTAAFGELGFRPVVAGQFAERSTATSVMGIDCALPVLISPTGVQAVHPQGEVAVGRAAANRGIVMGLSSFGSKPIEQVVAANSNTLFQIYWAGDRESMAKRMERAAQAGAKGLILTLDWSFSHGRDWGSPSIPQKFDIATILRHAPEVLGKPKWLASYLRDGGIPGLGVPNFTTGDAPEAKFFDAYGVWMMTPPPTWQDISWLRSQWDGPFMLKGITRVDDAHKAVAAGVSAISVSNHGGNNLDTTPASIRLLPEIADAVGDQIEVVMDGGIRRGSDVAKALALGAHAVMIGRAYLWGLAANGQAGVENVLDILGEGLRSSLLGLGKASIQDLSRDDIVIPKDFSPGS